MTTSLDKPFTRELIIDGCAYILTVSPEGLKLMLKGKRKGLELLWKALVSGEAALAVALNASLGKFTVKPGTGRQTATAVKLPKSKASGKRAG
jgi:hypothetical protein